jgi:MFS family permease
MSGAMAEFGRGWRPLLASAIGTGSGVTGLAFYGFGVFVLPLVTAFGWTRGEITTAASFLVLGTAFTAPVVGALIDRFGTRRVGLLSMLAGAAGLAALSTIGGSLGAFYAAWFIIALIGGGTTPVVWTRVVNLWFDRGRGLALGIALAGSGVASMLAPPLLTRVIAEHGWQGGYLAMGGFVAFVAVPLIALLLRESPPATVHGVADGVPQPAGVASATGSLPGVELAEALRSPVFWKIAISFFVVSGVISALIINLIPLLVDRGLDRTGAAGVAGLMGISVLVGRILIGFLLDRLSASLVAMVVLATCAGGCVILHLPGTPMALVVFSVIMLGLATAAEVDLVAYLSSRYFGLRAYGRIYGWQLTSFYLGAALGPVVAGVAYDSFGNYGPMLLGAATGLLIGAVVMTTLGRPQFRSAD